MHCEVRQRRKMQRAHFWACVKKALRMWEYKWTPFRWCLWRECLWGREGWYVLGRGAILLAMLTIVGCTTWGTSCQWWLRWIAICVSGVFLLDIMINHFSVAFVSRRPSIPLRTVFLGIVSFVEIPIAFAVFDLAAAASFNNFVPTWHKALYFAFVTATTLGDSTVNPKGILGESLVAFEVVIGLVFFGVLLASLIDLAGGKRYTGRGLL